MPRVTSYPAPIREGCKKFGDGDSWVNWWLFPRLTPAQVEDVMDDYDLTAWGNGPGTAYTRSGYAQHSKSYTLVTQHGGYDV